MRALYEFMMAGARAQARWECELARTVFRDRRRLFLLLLLVLPVLVPALAQAAELPKVLGGGKAYFPTHYTTEAFWGSTLVGLCAGLITGCIGAGGGFIITPFLMSFGVRGILAAGTDQFHIFAKAIMGTIIHRKLGNVNVALAVAFVVGSVAGATVGGTLNRWVYAKNPVLSDAFISTIYAVVLGFLGFYSLWDYFKLRRTGAAVDAHGGGVTEATTRFAKGLQSIKLPPMIRFDEDIVPGGRRISAWFVMVVGFVVGVFAAILGVGGGFITFPAFVYGLGVSSFTTVGTDILQIIFTAGYGSIVQYAIYGYVFYTLAIGLLLGSLIGIQVGSLATKVVKGAHIRGFFATVILAGFVNRAAALPGLYGKLGYVQLTERVGAVINTIGTVVFFALVLVFALWVFLSFFRNLRVLREEVV